MPTKLETVSWEEASKVLSIRTKWKDRNYRYRTIFQKLYNLFPCSFGCTDLEIIEIKHWGHEQPSNEKIVAVQKTFKDAGVVFDCFKYDFDNPDPKVMIGDRVFKSMGALVEVFLEHNLERYDTDSAAEFNRWKTWDNPVPPEIEYLEWHWNYLSKYVSCFDIDVLLSKDSYLDQGITTCEYSKAGPLAVIHISKGDIYDKNKTILSVLAENLKSLCHVYHLRYHDLNNMQIARFPDRNYKDVTQEKLEEFLVGLRGWSMDWYKRNK